jgi:hypothetical protein
MDGKSKTNYNIAQLPLNPNSKRSMRNNYKNAFPFLSTFLFLYIKSDEKIMMSISSNFHIPLSKCLMDYLEKLESHVMNYDKQIKL